MSKEKQPFVKNNYHDDFGYHCTIDFGKQAFGCGDRKLYLTEIEVSLKDNDGKPEFSASMNVWNTRHTDIVMGGQCLDDKRVIEILRGYPIFNAVFRLWKRNHLNGMHAGTPKQEEAIEEWRKDGRAFEYNKACEYLNSVGLLDDVLENGKSYRYGSAWLYRAISESDRKAIDAIFKGDLENAVALTA